MHFLLPTPSRCLPKQFAGASGHINFLNSPLTAREVVPFPVVLRSSATEPSLARDSDVLPRSTSSPSVSNEANEYENLLQPSSSSSEQHINTEHKVRSRNRGESKKEPLLRSAFRCKVGDIVAGKVIFANPKGAKIDLIDYPDVMG